MAEEIITVDQVAGAPAGPSPDGMVEDTTIVNEDLGPPTKMTHTVDEAPELLGKQTGEILPVRVVSVSEDGKTFELEFVPAEELAGEGAPPQPLAPGGEEGVVQTLIS